MDAGLLKGIPSSLPSPTRPSSSSSIQSSSSQGSSIILEAPASSSTKEPDTDASVRHSPTHNTSSSEGIQGNIAVSHLPILEQKLQTSPLLPSDDSGLDASHSISFKQVSSLLPSEISPIGAYLRENNRHENLLVKVSANHELQASFDVKDRDGKPERTSDSQATIVGGDMTLAVASISKKNDPDNTSAEDQERPSTPENYSLQVGLGGTHISVSSNIENESSDSGISDLSPTMARPQKRVRRVVTEDNEDEELFDILKTSFVRASDRAAMSRRTSTLKAPRVRKHKQWERSTENDAPE
ncbi:hypothetical protein BGZ63DRAFT_272219 [Mariannaea sp. PMI_226]|nr:hypothetical protein BGZ63DRAFT_272219 [Mariannaea sp. PMI_226]